jgi:hypothetical protein
MALVAAVGTRALADTDDGVSFGEDPDPRTEQPQPQTETAQLAAVNLEGNGGDGSTVMTGDPSQVVNPRDETRPEAAVVDAQTQPGTTGEQVAQAQDQPDQPRQEGDTTSCSDSPCSQDPEVPTALAAGPVPNGNGNGDDGGDAEFYEWLSSYPLEDQIDHIRVELASKAYDVRFVREQHPFDIDDFAENAHRVVANLLGYINLLESQVVEPAMQEQVATLSAQAQGLLREIEDLSVLSAMTDQEAARDATYRAEMDDDLATLEEVFADSVAARDRMGLEEVRDNLEYLLDQASRNEWSEQRARALALRDRIQQALDNLQHPMSIANFDTKIPVYSPVKGRQAPGLPGTSAVRVPGLPGTSAVRVPGLPGTSAVRVPGLPGTTETRLGDNGVLHAQATPSQKATSAIPANSDLRKLTLTEKAAFALGVDPSTIDHSIATSAVLLGGAGVLWLLSYVSPQLRLALMQGGLKAMPLMTTSRPVDG